LTNTYWEDSPAKLWDAKTGRLQAELGGPMITVNYDTKAAGVTAAGFSPDGKFIVTRSSNKVRLWETATAKLMGEFDDSSLVTDFSPDSKWLGLLNLETLKLWPKSNLNTDFLDQQVFSPDSRTYVVANGYDDYHATLIDVSSGRVRTKIPLVVKWGSDWISEYQKNADILSFHPGSEFLMGANHNSVRLWDVSTGTLVWETTEGRDPAAFTPDGKLLVTVGKDKKTVLLWSVVSK